MSRRSGARVRCGTGGHHRPPAEARHYDAAAEPGEWDVPLLLHPRAVDVPRHLPIVLAHEDRAGATTQTGKRGGIRPPQAPICSLSTASPARSPWTAATSTSRQTPRKHPAGARLIPLLQAALGDIDLQRARRLQSRPGSKPQPQRTLRSSTSSSQRESIPTGYATTSSRTADSHPASGQDAHSVARPKRAGRWRSGPCQAAICRSSRPCRFTISSAMVTPIMGASLKPCPLKPTAT